ncbi:MAG: cell division protein ZipA [Gammaproteobacteria bacterium]|nr:cell division protein ZipA [Gammaproteobacteria bacterium]
MDELRLSLIIIGVVIVGGVYLVGRMVERSRSPRKPEIKATPVMPSVVEHNFKMRVVDEPALQFRPTVASPPAFAVHKSQVSSVVTSAEKITQLPPRATQSEPELIVSLTLMARDAQKINGSELHAALQLAGLELGEFDIYHFRDADNDDDKRAIFSVANIIKPGTFDAATLHELSTPGLALFMQIPGPMTASEAFDAMLEKSQFIAQRLNGIVGDEQRTPLSPQRMRELRERTLQHDFSHSMQVGKDSLPQHGGR